MMLIGSGSVARVEKTLPSTLDTVTYQKIIVRVAKVAGTNTTWGVKVYDVDLPGWRTIWTGQTAEGEFELTLPEAGVSKIALLEEYVGGPTTQVWFDYVAICKNSLLVPDLGDLVKEMRITRPLLNKAVAGAKFHIPNTGGAYNGLIKGHDVVIIWLARSDADLGTIAAKAFGGRVVTPTNQGVQYGEFYIDLDCHGHAYELNIPPTLVQKYYLATNGLTIIEDDLGLCSYIAKNPDATKWFDNAGSSGSTDDRINSTHDCVYDEELPMTVIQEILDKAKNPAAVEGFDMYEMPSGCLVGHLRNSLDFVSPITSITPRNYQKSDDFHRIRNKIKVYGKKERAWSGLVSQDGWTESIAGWSSDYGAITTNADIPPNSVGSVSIQSDAGTNTNNNLYRTWSSFSCKFSREKRKLKFKFKAIISGANPYRINVLLFAPDISNCFRLLDIPITDNNKWYEFEYDIGPGSDWENSKYGSPDWANVSGFFVTHQTTPAGPSSHIIRLDILHFIDAYSGLAEDSNSQNLYGIRQEKPEIDEALVSDADCAAKAQALCNFLKEAIVTLSDVIVDGDNRYNPGDRQRVVVSNDGLDAYFRITQIEHVVRGTVWDTVLSLSNDPQFIEPNYFGSSPISPIARTLTWVLRKIKKERDVDVRRG